MARPRNPNRDKAREIWLQSGKKKPLKEIAAELGEREGAIRKWKCEGEWERGEKERSDSGKRNVTKPVPKKKKDDSLGKAMLASVEANEELTDKQRAFCLHYAKTYNAFASAVRAGYGEGDPTRYAYELLSKPHVREEVLRLKEMRNLAMLRNADDVIELHMRIAFSDITDFAEIKSRYIKLKADVDGQLIKKVGSGEMGPSIELKDSHKSMAFLERYFELNPLDRHKKEYDMARLEIEREKVGSNEAQLEDIGVDVAYDTTESSPE